MDDDDKLRFKCRKCRSVLCKVSDIVNCHGESKSWKEELVCDPQARHGEHNVLYLDDRIFLPDWVTPQIDLGNWVRGRLHCPVCSFRVGSYDFVSGTICPCGKQPLPAVHLVKSKVDCPPLPAEVMEQLSSSTPTTSHNFPLFNPDMTEVGATDVKKEEPELDKDMVTECPEECDKSSLLNQEHKVETKVPANKTFQEVESTEKDSDKLYLATLRASLTCPVCLDVFYSPFTCQPCGHVFCESCLRRVAKPCPTKTHCPLCRQLILSSEINKACGLSVKEHFYKKTQSNIRAEEIRILKLTSPLPWTPNHRFYGNNPYQQPSMFEMMQSVPRNLWTSLCLSLPTIALLFFLHLICIATFSVGYLVLSYIPPMMVHWLFAALRMAGVLISPTLEKEITLPVISPAWYATAMAVGISVLVWQKIKNA